MIGVIRSTFLVWLAAASPIEVQRVSWPTVLPQASSFDIRDVDNAAVDFVIRGKHAEALYLLQCRSSWSETAEAETGFSYSGDFECRLKSVQKPDVYSTLLTENPFQDRDWQSRGRFFTYELVGPCATYPEFGRNRTFRLRGMLISLSFSEVTLSSRTEKPKLESFRFHVAVKPDDTALSAIAESVPFTSPFEYLDAATCEDPPPNAVSQQASRAGQNTPSLRSYPLVRRNKKSRMIPTRENGFSFADQRLPKEDVALYLPVWDVSGNLAYEVECSTYETRTGRGYSIIRWGISCGLFMAGDDSNLLSSPVDPVSRLPRSHILPRQLLGRCAEYPDWGAVREFRLRAMKVTIWVADVIGDPSRSAAEVEFEQGIDQARLVVSVEPDPTATMPMPDVSPYSDPAWNGEPRCETLWVHGS